MVGKIANGETSALDEVTTALRSPQPKTQKLTIGAEADIKVTTLKVAVQRVNTFANVAYTTVGPTDHQAREVS